VYRSCRPTKEPNGRYKYNCRGEERFNGRGSLRMICAWSRCMAFGRFMVLICGMAAGVVFAGDASAADRKLNVIPTAVPAVTAPSGAELVGKLLENGPSDPDVPLPQPNLSAQ